MSPITKAEIPEIIAASIPSARTGLLTISSKMVLPAGTDLYKKLIENGTMKNNTDIAIINPIDHLPNVVFGIRINFI